MAGKHPKDHDTLIIRRIIEGDKAAFRILVEKYKDVSFSLAQSILKDEAKAEDVLQEVFIKVYEKINRFQFKSAFSTWLYRIVINTCYNELKKQKIKVSIEDVDQNLFDDAPAGGLRITNDADQKKYIQLAIARLRSDEALVLRLFYLCELSIKEIEDITGFKATKIKVDLHRGRDNLYFQLKQLLGDEINQLL